MQNLTGTKRVADEPLHDLDNVLNGAQKRLNDGMDAKSNNSGGGDTEKAGGESS